MRELRELKLPQIVAARNPESQFYGPSMGLGSDLDLDHLESILTTPTPTSQSPSSSNFPSPVTSTFSPAHSRFPSSTSSLTSSPSLGSCSELFGTGRRPLTEVKEEPHEPDASMDASDDGNLIQPPTTISQQDLRLDTFALGAYSPHNGQCVDVEPILSGSRVRERRVLDSPIPEVTSRIGPHFLSLSHKRKRRTTGDQSPTNPKHGLRILLANGSPSSGRSPMFGSAQLQLGQKFPPSPASPARSTFDEPEHKVPIEIEMSEADESGEDEPGPLPRTPLLPPLMNDPFDYAHRDYIQSPLQSPTVADVSEALSMKSSAEFYHSSTSLPSPPLSSKPSFGSVRNQPDLQITLTNDIPPLKISDPDDKWAKELGHANFFIYPEPYTPESYDLESFRQLRDNWQLAKKRYFRHELIVAENYGHTSNTYNLTQKKWKEINGQWKEQNNLIAYNLSQQDNALYTFDLDNFYSEPSAKMPTLHYPLSDGKFPKMGDEGIVGLMDVVSPPSPQSLSKKRKLIKFWSEFKNNTSVLIGRATRVRHNTV
ncbi:MAG: hypothetical protein M1834_003316 [Cirrosporium novae-zelandiae]|nr:MAG: hypothetical protein M1834_003316 [Cirrosporium novae-zelandiae]